MPNAESGGGEGGAKHVVIVGGGFAGLNCALRLAGQPGVRVTLVDRDNYQQFQPLLYQVATSLLSAGNAAFALREVLRGHTNVDIAMGEVTVVDIAQRRVKTADGASYAGDILVLATGAQVNFFGTPGAEQYARPLYTLRDAEALRSAILQAFESAERQSESAGAGSLHFLVVGGGPTGVELAGTLRDMTERVLKTEFHRAGPRGARISLIERSGSLLGTFSEVSQSYALRTLQARGVEVRTGVAVQEVTATDVLLSTGERLASTVVIWAAGVRAEGAPHDAHVSLTKSGRIEVAPDLRVRGFDAVYALGDVANGKDEDGRPLPQLAAVAQQAGRHCAHNILESIAGRETEPFRYSDRGILAMIGRNAAVAELGKTHHQLTGPLAFATWLGVHVALLTVVRAKLEAVVEWAWEYFLGGRPEQLIDR